MCCIGGIYHDSNLNATFFLWGIIWATYVQTPVSFSKTANQHITSNHSTNKHMRRGCLMCPGCLWGSHQRSRFCWLCFLTGCHGSNTLWWWSQEKATPWWQISSSASSTQRSASCLAAPPATGPFSTACGHSTRARVVRRQTWSLSMMPCGLSWRRTSCLRLPWLPRRTGLVT